LTTPEQPFHGVSVLEFGHFIAVPWAGQVLADGGAHVIKIEPPEGEPSRYIAPIVPGESRHFVIRNRGKHALPLDLRHPDAREILEALLARADVVLANMRPGLAAELGLEYEQLAPRYPRLVVGTVTAFGPRGPDAALAGMDHVVQARSGLMVTGGRVLDGLPTSGESPIADYMAATLLAFGVATAL
jgi:formyl-CoA transferase